MTVSSFLFLLFCFCFFFFVLVSSFCLFSHPIDLSRRPSSTYTPRPSPTSRTTFQRLRRPGCIRHVPHWRNCTSDHWRSWLVLLSFLLGDFPLPSRPGWLLCSRPVRVGEATIQDSLQLRAHLQAWRCRRMPCKGHLPVHPGHWHLHIRQLTLFLSSSSESLLVTQKREAIQIL